MFLVKLEFGTSFFVNEIMPVRWCVFSKWFLVGFDI